MCGAKAPFSGMPFHPSRTPLREGTVVGCGTIYPSWFSLFLDGGPPAREPQPGVSTPRVPLLLPLRHLSRLFLSTRSSSSRASSPLTSQGWLLRETPGRSLPASSWNLCCSWLGLHQHTLVPVRLSSRLAGLPM